MPLLWLLTKIVARLHPHAGVMMMMMTTAVVVDAMDDGQEYLNDLNELLEVPAQVEARVVASNLHDGNYADRVSAEMVHTTEQIHDDEEGEEEAGATVVSSSSTALVIAIVIVVSATGAEVGVGATAGIIAVTETVVVTIMIDDREHEVGRVSVCNRAATAVVVVVVQVDVAMIQIM
jgi:hypothetical protein